MKTCVIVSHLTYHLQYVHCFCLIWIYPMNTPLFFQVQDHGVRIGFQLLGGIFIILWSLTLVTLVFSILWFFPVKLALACLP